MSQDLPTKVDRIDQENGTITYATEVIATIVGVATTEVEGIASMAGSASISELLSGRPKNLSRGVRVEVGAEEVSVDVSVIVDYGMPIQAVGLNVQENIRKSIETMTGLHVIKVDVHVLGVSFEKENKELEQSQEVARLQSSNSSPRYGGALQEGDTAARADVSEGKIPASSDKIKVEFFDGSEEAAGGAEEACAECEAEPGAECTDEAAPPCDAPEQADDAKSRGEKKGKRPRPGKPGNPQEQPKA